VLNLSKGYPQSLLYAGNVTATERIINEIAKSENALQNGLKVLRIPDKQFSKLYKEFFDKIVYDPKLTEILNAKKVNNLINRSSIFKNADALNTHLSQKLEQMIFSQVKKILGKGKPMSYAEIKNALRDPLIFRDKSIKDEIYFMLHSSDAQSQIYFNQIIRKQAGFVIRDSKTNHFANILYKDYFKLESKVLNQLPRKILDDVSQISVKTVRGEMSWDDAVREVMGLKAPNLLELKDKKGHNINTTSYLKTRYRDSMSEFNQENLKNQMEEFGEDLVITDVLADGCELCAP